MSNYLQEHSNDSNIDRTTSPSQKLHKALIIYPSVYLFSTKKKRVDLFPSALPGAGNPPKRGGGVSGNQLADHRRLKLMAPKVWIGRMGMLGRGMFFSCSVWLQGY